MCVCVCVCGKCGSVGLQRLVSDSQTVSLLVPHSMRISLVCTAEVGLSSRDWSLYT